MQRRRMSRRGSGDGRGGGSRSKRAACPFCTIYPAQVFVFLASTKNFIVKCPPPPFRAYAAR